MQAQDLAQYIDHTALKSDVTENDVKKLCQEAVVNSFYGVCINSMWLKLAKKELSAFQTKIVCVVGFPLGASLTRVKAQETELAIEQGADEIDMVLNIGSLKSGSLLDVQTDIEQVVRMAAGRPVKVILETHLLSDAEKETACRIAVKAGARFVKTSTGFTGGGATLQDVILMKKAVGNLALVKASGGIKSSKQAIEMIKNGANRIGTSSGISLISETTSASSGRSGPSGLSKVNY